MSELKYELDQSDVHKDINSLIEKITIKQKIHAISLVEVTTGKRSYWFKAILIGIVLIIGSKLLEKGSEYVGKEIMPPFLEFIFTPEGIFLVLVLSTLVYILYQSYKLQNPQTDLAVLTAGHIYLIEGIKSSIHGVSASEVTEIPLFFIKEYKELPTNFLSTEWYLETSEKDETMVWLDQKTMWDMKYRIGKNGVPLKQFFAAVRSTNPVFFDERISRVGDFRKFLMNISYVLSIAIPLFIGWMVLDLDTSLREEIRGNMEESSQLSKEQEPMYTPGLIAERAGRTYTNETKSDYTSSHKLLVKVPSLKEENLETALSILSKVGLVPEIRYGYPKVIAKPIYIPNSKQKEYFVFEQTPSSQYKFGTSWMVDRNIPIGSKVTLFIWDKAPKEKVVSKLAQRILSSDKRWSKKPFNDKAIYRFGSPNGEYFYERKFEINKTRIAGVSFYGKRQVLSKDLPFYPSYSFLYIEGNSSKSTNPTWFLYKENSNTAILLDKTNKPIYELNTSLPIKLNYENVKDYVRFFFSVTYGKHGRFLIVESVEDIEWYKMLKYSSIRKDAECFIEPLIYRGITSSGLYQLNASIFFKGTLYHSKIFVSSSGRIEIEEGKTLDLSIITTNRRRCH